MSVVGLKNKRHVLRGAENSHCGTPFLLVVDVRALHARCEESHRRQGVGEGSFAEEK